VRQESGTLAREQRRKFVAQQGVDRQAGKPSLRPATQPRRDLADYAGDYEHPGYGRITITHVEGKLHWAFRRIGTTIRSSCPRHPSRPVVCYPVILPSHFPLTAKEALRSRRRRFSSTPTSTRRRRRAPPPPANVSPNAVALFQNTKRLKLDVAQHVPIHGNPVGTPTSSGSSDQVAARAPQQGGGG
jgi:hypothetical protein